MLLSKIALLTGAAITALAPLNLVSEELPTDYFIRPLASKNAELSPDGLKIAYQCSLKNIEDGVWGVFSQSVVDDTKSGWKLHDYEDIDSFVWLNNDYVGFSFWNNAVQSIDLRIGRFGDKAPGISIAQKPLMVLKTAQNHPYFYALTDLSNGRKGIARFSQATGESEVYGVVPPDHVMTGISDFAGNIRLVQVTESGETKWKYLPSGSNEWKELSLNGYDTILGFNGDSEQFLVADSFNKPTQGIYLYDPDKDDFVGNIYWNKHFDLNGSSLIVDSASGTVLGVNYDDYFPKTQWFNPDMAQIQQVLNKSIPNNINRVVGVNLNEEIYLIESLSDRHPKNYYILNLKNNELKQVLSGAPWIDPDKMAASNVVQYENRDGLKLFGYFTKTVKKVDGIAPTIVICHGDSWSRATWGWDPLTQFLAYHGYNVLKLNTRGCAGMGWSVPSDNMNFLQIAEDTEDAVSYFVSKGLIDKSKVGIMGNNNAALVAAYEAYKNPELFHCALASNGIYDLEKFIDSKRNGSDSMKNLLMKMEEQDPSLFDKSLSPVNHEIKMPMHVAFGCHQCIGKDDDALAMLRRAEESGVKVASYEKSNWRGRLWSGEYGVEYYDSVLGFLKDVMPSE